MSLILDIRQKSGKRGSVIDMPYKSELDVTMSMSEKRRIYTNFENTDCTINIGIINRALLPNKIALLETHYSLMNGLNT